MQGEHMRLRDLFLETFESMENKQVPMYVFLDEKPPRTVQMMIDGLKSENEEIVGICQDLIRYFDWIYEKFLLTKSLTDSEREEGIKRELLRTYRINLRRLEKKDEI